MRKILLILPAGFSSRLYKEAVLMYGAQNVCRAAQADLALEFMKNHRPDIVVLLPSEYPGCMFDALDMQRLKKALRFHLIVLALPNGEAAPEEADRLPADLTVYPPFRLPQIIHTLDKKLWVHTRAGQLDAAEKKYLKLLEDAGFRKSQKGFYFLAAALAQYEIRPWMRKNLAGHLYPTLAKRFGATPRIIERAMLRTLDKAWDDGSLDRLGETLDLPPELGLLPPCCGRFFDAVTGNFRKLTPKEKRERNR